MEEIALYENETSIYSINDLFELNISDDTHFIFKIVEELSQKKGEHIVIWGTYYNAIKCSNWLMHNYGIAVEACIVNKEYVNLSINNVREEDRALKFLSLEEYLSENKNVDIIIDFSYYNSELLKGFENRINRVFVGDIMGVFIFDSPYYITQTDLMRYKKELMYTYSNLKDEASKSEFLDFICQKIYGFYNKKHHNIQYFDDSVIELNDNEIYVDAGAYDGDSIRNFIERSANSYQHIYAIEMDRDNYKLLTAKLGTYKDITFMNNGVGGTKTTLYAKSGNSTTHIDEVNGDTIVQIERLDDIIEGGVSFIKMDIEGYEYEALTGGKNLITTYKPKLAICMYHKFEDLWKIPQIVLNYSEDYDIYFRNYHNSASESVLYAVPRTA